MLDEKIKCSFKEIPFKSSFSLDYLVVEIEKNSRQKTNPLYASSIKALKSLDELPEMKGSITDFSLIEKNRKLINQLMAFAINPLNSDTELVTAMAPFIPKPIYSSKLYDETMRGDHIKIEMAKEIGKNNILLAVIYQAYLIILQRFYGFDFEGGIPFVYKRTNEKDMSVRYYKMIVNHKYTDVKVEGELRELSQQDLKSMFDNTENLDYWNELIPLDKFEFTGFLHFTYVEITHDYVISQLKSDLLDKNAIITQVGFNGVREKVRTLTGIPDLEFGLAAFAEFESSINQNVIWKSILTQSELSCDEYVGTVYERAYYERKVILTDDIKEQKKDKVANLFLKKGIRSHAVIPLILDDEIVGMIEFGAKTPGKLNLVQIKRFHELFPVFSIALKRSKDEMNDRVQAIIQEECTAIHPTVEWRFWEAASNMLDSDIKGEPTKMESIVFPDVVPLYGASDIRNSSIERTNAIQADLISHMSMAKAILINGMVDKEMPLLDHLVYKIDKHMQTVNSGLKAGDEVSILEFIKHEIEPVFTQLKERDNNLAEQVETYFLKMDDELGVLYNKRKDFEESLTLINDVVGNILDEEQTKAQQVYPHYFEKYRTDGVEYNAYIGQSMVKTTDYHDIYLKNLRLWQLLVKAKIARKIRELSPKLKIELDVTQLILVHSNPLSIAFRHDEKKFDVAGAYNIRYEITKKRIDKALIKGTNKRITQVGKIAIIYSHAEEIEEYRKYIGYMIAKGILKETVEDFELEDMKGASGLRAMRVDVDFGTSSSLDEISISEIKKVIEKN